MKPAACDPFLSGVFESAVRHERFVPRAHAFRYRLFYLALELDELPRLRRSLKILGINRPGLMSFWEKDAFPVGEPVHRPTSPSMVSGSTNGSSLRERVIGWCATRGFDLGPDARVLLVTLPRIFGYGFNPVSFYFCFDHSGKPQAVVAEVTNTFREVKPYLVPPQVRADGKVVFRLRAPKQFYVSPFSPCEASFDFAFRVPDNHLAIQIDHYEGSQRTVHTTLTGTRRPLTDATLVAMSCKYPLVALRVISLIHWQALRLWAKKVPFFRKTTGGEHQRDLHRPHASLRATNS